MKRLIKNVATLYTKGDDLGPLRIKPTHSRTAIDFGQSRNDVTRQINARGYKGRPAPITILRPGDVFGLERRNPNSIRKGRRDYEKSKFGANSALFRVDQAGDIRPYDVAPLPHSRRTQIRQQATRLKKGRQFVVDPR